MDLINHILLFITDNAIALGVLGTAIAGIVNFYQFVKVRKAELRQKEYENYHKLIDRLNIPQPGTGYPLLDMQVSAIFELRYYPLYKELTYRILSGWITRTKNDRISEIAKDALGALEIPINIFQKFLFYSSK